MELDDRAYEPFIARAVATRAPLLAVRLAEHARATHACWKALAESLGLSVGGLNRLACCRPPRPERFQEDTDEIALHTGASSASLLALFRQLGIRERNRARSGRSARRHVRSRKHADSDEPIGFSP